MNTQLPSSWKSLLNEELKATYFEKLSQFVEDNYQQNTCFPPKELLFEAFKLCPLEDVKVILLGQDPYHKKGLANGLSFSVNREVAIPASLRNIYKELNTDIGFKNGIPLHGDLSYWAKQGVLLLNTCLTVEMKKAGSHKKQGWETFTDAVIEKLSQQKKGLVFLLWGNFAKEKKHLIDDSKHCILMSGHPSFAAVHKKWFGNKHFSSCNTFLKDQNKTPIDWTGL